MQENFENSSNLELTLLKKCPYLELSGPYFPAFRLNNRDTAYLSVFSLNVGKYGPE